MACCGRAGYTDEERLSQREKAGQIATATVGIALIAFGIFFAFNTVRAYFRGYSIIYLLEAIWSAARLLNGVWWCLTVSKAKAVGKSVINAPAILSAVLIILLVVLVVAENM